MPPIHDHEHYHERPAWGREASGFLTRVALVAVFAWVPIAVGGGLIARWVRDGVTPEPILTASLAFWLALLWFAFGSRLGRSAPISGSRDPRS